MSCSTQPSAGQPEDRAATPQLNFGGLLAKLFIHNKLTAVLMLSALLFGLVALMVTPREENPQISVPAAAVIVPFPGATPQELEQLVANPLEQLLWSIKGVEHVNSTCFPNYAVVTAQFKVNENQDISISKVFNQVNANLDVLPQGILQPLIKPVDIDEVPVVAITLFSPSHSAYELRQVAQQLQNELRAVPGTNKAVIAGGDNRTITVELDPVRAAAFAIDSRQLAQALEGANSRLPADELENGSQRISIQSGQFLRTAEDIGNVVVTARSAAPGAPGRPVFLHDIATIHDGPPETSNLSRLSFGQDVAGLSASRHGLRGAYYGPKPTLAGREFNAVSLGIAKQRGRNAVLICEQVISRMQALAPSALPDDCGWVVTRDDGVMADDTVNELVLHIAWAIAVVLVILALSLGWREAAVTALAIPLTLLLSIGVASMAGQTLHRISIGVLIFCIGLLIDQAVVVVENIHRHLTHRRSDVSVTDACIASVNEIAYPTTYATFAIALTMLALVCMTGTIGAFTKAIPLIVPVAMIVSLLVAFVVTPYLAIRWLKIQPTDANVGAAASQHGASTRLLSFYSKLLTPFMHSAARRNTMFIGLLIALGICFTFPALQIVKLNILPKSNKNTFLVYVDMPAGSSLNATDKLVSELEQRLLRERTVQALVTTTGAASIPDFSGLMRGGSARNDPALADIRVRLVSKNQRKITSIELVQQLRPEMSALGDKYGAIVKLIEDPPGPATRSTILAEIYGPYGERQHEQVARMHKLFASTAQVVDVDDSLRATAKQLQLSVNAEKARLAGLSTKDVTSLLYASFAGYRITALHNPGDNQQTPVVLRFPAAYRNQPSDLENIMLPSPAGLTPLSALCDAVSSDVQAPIYHKDLRPVSYVYGEVQEGPSSLAVISMTRILKATPLAPGFELKWEGEQDQINTVIHDMSFSMLVAIILIYLLLLSRFRSFSDPLVILSVVPLTMLGVLPGYAILGLFGLYINAISLIGVIALAGIVVRNSIILIEFIKDAVAEGSSLEQAVILAGAIRTRPILLTATAAVAGMLVVIRDPIWSGMSWTLLFGVFASTPLSLLVVPVLYYAVAKLKASRGPSAGT